MSTSETPAGLAPFSNPLTDEQTAGLGAALLVLLAGGMTALHGLPGLAMTALAMVPVMMVVLLLITVGK